MNAELQLKSKLAWPEYPKSMKLKQKWYMSNDYSYKCCFYWVITWKLLFSGWELTFSRGGIKIWWGGVYWGGIFPGAVGWANLWLMGGTPPFPPVGKTLKWVRGGEGVNNRLGWESFFSYLITEILILGSLHRDCQFPYRWLKKYLE